MSTFTRRCHAPHPIRLTWLVLVGDDCQEVYLKAAIPDEDYVRKALGLKQEIPILIGMP